MDDKHEGTAVVASYGAKQDFLSTTSTASPGMLYFAAFYCHAAPHRVLYHAAEFGHAIPWTANDGTAAVALYGAKQCFVNGSNTTLRGGAL